MNFFQEENYIARVYYESMRDNFEGYAWDAALAGTDAAEKTSQLNQLKDDFDTLDPLTNNKPTLGQLFKIELALIWLVPETSLRSRFWTIEDRFRRVVPRGVVRSYETSLASDPPGPIADDVLRQRARNLLDVIHANYLINLARENSIRRLMAILAAVATAVTGTCALGLIFLPFAVLQGMLLIVVAGMIGAIISIIQRLQKATSRDAMVDDGIFELIGLRIGWLSIVMSVIIGGVFALFIYVLIAADLFDLLVPQLDEGNDEGQGTANTNDGTSSETDGSWVAPLFAALGLKSQIAFFKLIGYSFASGFAERFVPDIINKLTKQASVPAGMTG